LARIKDHEEKIANMQELINVFEKEIGKLRDFNKTLEDAVQTRD
jgi:hypothetical protein